MDLWEKSVRATHHFLLLAGFDYKKAQVAGIDLMALTVWRLAENENVIGFVGVAGTKLEMLFVDPGYFGRGVGKRLLDFAVTQLHARVLDVNEQNPRAIAFYQKHGFEPYERTVKDEQGRNYPLLRMRLKKNK